MTEEEKRAHALAAGLKALELFVPTTGNRTVVTLMKYTMLCYNWINTGAITNSDIALQAIEPPYIPPPRPAGDNSAKTATKVGG